MLTKEERAEIAERLKNVSVLDGDYAVYQAVTGKSVLYGSPTLGDIHDMRRVILDLCDTSNMIELPIDKDGEVIRVGDTVYIGDGIKYEVAGYMMRGNSTEIILAAGAEPVYTKEPANDIAHKQPVTAKSLAARIRDVLKNDYSEMSPYTSRELVHIANDLECLGDNNE